MLQPTLIDDVAEPADEGGLVASALVIPGSFALLYDRYVDAVYGYCYRYLRSREAAEDATSATFEKAFRNLPNFRQGSFRAWLFAIAHNVVFDQFRGASGRSSSLDEIQLSDPAAGPEEAFLATEQEETLRELLARLNHVQREPIELRLAGLSGDEICALLQISPGVLAARTYRGMNRLRELAAASPKGNLT